MSAEPPVNPAIFDSAQFEMVRALISTERMRVHLDDLDRQVSALTASTSENIQPLAHKIVSQAGMLGLLRLSDRARALENSCGGSAGFASSLLACREAAADLRRYAMPAIGAST